MIHRDLIIALAAQHKLPAVYYERYYVGAGGRTEGRYSITSSSSISTGAQPAMSIASSKARNRVICRFKRQPNTNWSLTCGPLRHLALPCQTRCLAAPDIHKDDRYGAGCLKQWGDTGGSGGEYDFRCERN